ncbi:hypothetical protein chiPu_0018757 [Chiloscyllium punctatum]|uniref:Uncharacterized protein n=1 Tax=Chiloscyllium punctatum TaxID=137246 RepID=A0A401RPM4_CHIPU|nr:hypothetical protein [Chiloscyllium punctatum]
MLICRRCLCSLPPDNYLKDQDNLTSPRDEAKCDQFLLTNSRRCNAGQSFTRNPAELRIDNILLCGNREINRGQRKQDLNLG